MLNVILLVWFQAVNNKEYMVAAADENEMNEWLDRIHRCMEEDSSAPKLVLISSDVLLISNKCLVKLLQFLQYPSFRYFLFSVL